MFGSRINTKTLASVSRSLARLLDSGVPIGKAFRIAAEKTRNPNARRVLTDLVDAIGRGETISAGFRRHEDAIPDLFLEMVHVGEESGMLPEVLKNLAVHYENRVRLTRNFLSSLAYPVLQYIAAVGIIALMILVLGMIGNSRPGAEASDPLGFGLTGTSGAITWLLLNFGTVGGIVGGIYLIRRNVAGQRWLDPLLMKIPIVGACLRDFAIARFSWAYALTQQTGMSILRTLELSLRATGNGAYIRQTERIRGYVAAGEPVSDALTLADGFPVEYVSAISIAEDAGTVPEALERLSPQFEEQAERSLSRMATATGWLVWTLTAIFIIVLIFRIVFNYVQTINSLL